MKNNKIPIEAADWHADWLRNGSILGSASIGLLCFNYSVKRGETHKEGKYANKRLLSNNYFTKKKTDNVFRGPFYTEHTRKKTKNVRAKPALHY